MINLHFKPIDINKYRKHIIQFRRDSFIVSFGTDENFGDEKDYIDWLVKKSGEFPQGFLMVMEDGSPIGQIELTIVEYEGSKIGYINLYYLIPKKRGYGLGDELHKYALGFFYKHNVEEYHLRVSPDNKYALSFYHKKGLIEMGKEHGGKVIRMKGIL